MARAQAGGWNDRSSSVLELACRRALGLESRLIGLKGGVAAGQTLQTKHTLEDVSGFHIKVEGEGWGGEGCSEGGVG